MDIIVTDLKNTISELLLDFFYESFSYEYERNNSRTVSFTAYMTSHNKDVYNMLQNESFVEYEGQTYVIKNTNPKMNGNIHTNEVIAHHIMYEFQNHYISKDIVNEELNNEEDETEQELQYSLQDYLDFGFRGNKLGYTYEIKGNFPNTKAFDELGDKNGIEFLVEGAEQFGYIFFADNKKIYIYDESTFYKQSELVIRYQLNNDEVEVSVNTNDLKTYVKGYGKKKNKTETKNYNPIKPPDLKYNGTFIKEGTWRTEKVGASFEKIFNCKWGNETLVWSLKKMSKGGLFDVYLDGDYIGRFSCYSRTSRSENIVIAKNLSKGTHIFKVVHRGADPNVNEYKTPPVMYVGTEKSTTLNLTAVLKGTDVYHTTANYKSPNYNTFGHRQAPDVFDDKITNKTDLENLLKSQLNDEPEVELTTNYIDTEKVSERDEVWFIHEPMEFDTSVKVISLKKAHPYMNVPDEIGFSNNKTDIIKIQQTINNRIKNVSKAINRANINNIYGQDRYFEEPIVGSVIIDG